MNNLMENFEQKLVANGLAAPRTVLLGLRDARLCWNRPHPHIEALTPVFEQLNINSLLCARPAEPYATIIDYLCGQSGEAIRPGDCETRTFLHDLPVADEFSAQSVAGNLRRRKCVITPGPEIVTYGTVSLEQAYITFSSVCFACFVNFFGQLLQCARRNLAPAAGLRHAYQRACDHLAPPPVFSADLMPGPLEKPGAIYRAVEQAGRRTVALGLVDSFFGNISYCDGRTLFISQTGSSLDDLRGCIDPCPLDGSSCAAITASSELTAHLKIVRATGARAILHGHPKFSVILSMDCEQTDCPHAGECHRRCPRPRKACGMPIVSGEVGTGPYGLCHTVPEALAWAPGVIVYGHGVFTTAWRDFNSALDRLVQIENGCRRECFSRLAALRAGPQHDRHGANP